jgi:pimeloyl-ACP methyl ester carboxylesterase
MASQLELTVDGVRSPVTDIGPRAGEAVVFVHGNPGSRLDWSELGAATSQFARAVALDMPGYGQAAKPADFDYTVAGYARHLAGALDQSGLARVHLVLHDFGGPWGLAWAAGHPDRIGSLTLGPPTEAQATGQSEVGGAARRSGCQRLRQRVRAPGRPAEGTQGRAHREPANVPDVAVSRRVGTEVIT